MPPNALPACVDTVIVGSGPSALILSYILHGNIPHYDADTPHPDPILHGKLSDSTCLLDIDTLDLTAHFGGSRISYSTQALPLNVLLDTLIRPLADTEPGEHRSCVRWQKEPRKAVCHVVLGNTDHTGGQWADNPVAASWDIGALSYAEMLSLPGYDLTDHLKAMKDSSVLSYDRPTRRQIADYLAAYPAAVGIGDAIWSGSSARGISRTEQGFHIASHGISCKRLVLASGVFSRLIPARQQLQPLLRLPDRSSESDQEPPLLVVGSGFTAADIIITNLPKRRIIHIFKWDPDARPSPLRACHPRAYPDYAGVYRQMKKAVANTTRGEGALSPMSKRNKRPFFDARTWEKHYEGLPNTYIKEVSVQDGRGRVSLELADKQITTRDVSNLSYVIGRRGSLDYLDERLREEVLGGPLSSKTELISGQSLRSKVEESIQVAPDVFAIGSLTGDSLIRFAFGGCIFAAREIIARRRSPNAAAASNGATYVDRPVEKQGSIDDYRLTNGHEHLGTTTKGGHSLDQAARADVWRKSGLWSGSCGVS